MFINFIPNHSSHRQLDMDEKDLLRRDVYDLLEESAVDCTHNITQDLIQVATSPKAHGCVQGVVERRFYPMHIRDYYSVINILLLQLLLLRQRITGDKLAGEVNRGSVSNTEAMQRKILSLERDVKESKKRYKELLKINQQWAKDYTELNKKLEDNYSEPPHLPGPSLSCSQCVQYVHELDEKTELLKDLSLNYEKVKLIQGGLETRLEDSEQENKEIKDEHKILSLKLQELGGISIAMRYKDERLELIEEIRRLREKVTAVERERASLQTQFNRFRYSLKGLMMESDYRSSNGQTWHSSSDYRPSNGHVPQTWHPSSYGSPPNHMKAPQLFTDSSGGCTNKSANTRSNGVNPKHFAPIKTNWKPLPTGYQDCNTPQTPPGYLSRGNLFDDSISELSQLTAKPKESPKYLNLPSCSDYQKSQDLPSPLNVPRPMSAPGSLIDSSSYNTPQIHKAHLYSPEQEVKKNGFTTTYSQTPYSHHHTSNINPCTTYTPPVHKLNSLAQGGYFKCPHCGAKFRQTCSNDYDIWFDHVAECTC